MPVCRLIFRLDFKLLFEMFNKTGEIMKKMDEAGEDFWNNYIDDTQKRMISARNESETDLWARSINVCPQSIDGIMLTHKGVSLEGLESDDTFRKLIKVTNNIRKQFRINNLIRCGLRLFYFEKLNFQDDNINLPFQKTINNHIINGIITELGEINDLGIVFDGAHEDKIKYHFRCGPYYNREASKYITHFSEKFKENKDFNFIADIDLYENDFSLSESVSLIKWCIPVLVKAKNCINIIENCLYSKKDEKNEN